MKILWFDHNFSCPEGAGGTRTYRLARGLADAGHDVTVVCVTDLISKSGLKGAFRHDRREGKADGIRVIEFDLADGMARTSRLRSRLRLAAEIVRLASSGRFDLTVATSASPPGVLVGIWARFVRGTPLVFEIHSIRSRVKRALRLGNPLVNNLAGLIEKCAYRASGRIIAAGDDLAEAAIALGAGRHKIEIVPHVSDGALFREAGEIALAERFPEAIAVGNLIAVFAGRFDAAHGLGAVLDAAELLSERGRDDISFILIGDGPQRRSVMDAVVRRKLTRVVVANPMAAQDLPAVLKSGDIGLAIVNGKPAVHGAIEAENLADYLNAGLPVLINYPGWAAGLVVQHDSGMAVRPGDAGAFAGALEHAADQREHLARMAGNAADLGARSFDADDRLKAFVGAVEAMMTETEARAGQRLKRCFDAGLSCAALVLLSPLLVVLAAVVRCSLGAPLFFRETRPGLFGRPIELLRFRTRRDAYRADGGMLADEEQQTLVGRLITATSLSSLPLLWNVLRGDLSLVGPAVLPMQDLSRLSSRAYRRQFMRPGLIGLAQSGGPEGDPLARDLWYVENQSLSLDIRILAKTIFRTPRKRAVPVASFRPGKENRMSGQHNDRATR